MAKAFLLALLACVASVEATTTTAAANPVRKVVTLLQNMQKKVTAEGEVAEELYEKFMCYCKTSGGDLAKGIEGAKTKVPDLQSSIEEGISKKEQLEKDLKQHQSDRAAAKASMEEATAIREKEKAAFEKEAAEDEANMAALKKAVKAIEAGMGGSFLQTGLAARLRNAVQDSSKMIEADREEILSFLEGGDEESAQGSGEITGILKTMGEQMDKDYKEMVAAEEASVKSYEELMAAKKKEVETLSKAIENKLKRVGDLGVEIESMKNDLTDTQESLVEDQKFLKDMEKNCKSKTAEWEEQKKMRALELTALADTIKILNDDDALELFKKTLPSASSFLQVQVSSKALRAEALSMVSKMKQRFSSSKPKLNFIALALHGKKIGFDKIIKLIDDLVATLKQEQVDDDSKKEYCDQQFDQSEDKKKGLEQSLSDVKTEIEDAKEGISTLTEEIAALEEGIKELDKAVTEATEQRKKESAEYEELMSSNAAAKELILFAKNRLNKFYNPKLYKAPPKTEAEEASFVQVRATVQDEEAPPPPPETFDAYTKKSEESGGVLQMMDLLVADLDKEMTEAKVEEKNAQKEYEETMKDSAEKRAQDSKSLTDKSDAKATLQTSLEEAKMEKKSTKKELYATEKYIHSLHGECDWLLEYFDVRKEARTSEIDALGKAKAVLNGADYSFLQMSASSKTRSFLRRK